MLDITGLHNLATVIGQVPVYFVTILAFAGNSIPGLEAWNLSDSQFKPALEIFKRVQTISLVIMGGIIAISILKDIPSYLADWKSAIGSTGKRYAVCAGMWILYSSVIFPLPLWLGQGIGTAIDPAWFATSDQIKRVASYTPKPTQPGATPTPAANQTPDDKNGGWFTSLVGWATSITSTGVTSVFMILCYLIFFIVIAVICALWTVFVVILYITGPLFICLGLIKGWGEKMLANYCGALVQCALWPVWMGLCTALIKSSIVTNLEHAVSLGSTETTVVGQQMVNIQMVSYCAVFMVLYAMTPMAANMVFPLSTFGQLMGMAAKKATDGLTMAAGVAIGAATGGIGAAPLLGSKAAMGAKVGASMSQSSTAQLASKGISGLSSAAKSEITGAGASLNGFDSKSAGFGKSSDSDFQKLYKKGLSSFEGGGEEYLNDLSKGKTEKLPTFDEAIKNGFSPDTAKVINDSLAAYERSNGASSVRSFGASPQNVPTYEESLKNGYGDIFSQQRLNDINELDSNWDSLSNSGRAQAIQSLPTYNNALRQQYDAPKTSNINKNRRVLESQGKMPHENYSVKSLRGGGIQVLTPNSVIQLDENGNTSRVPRTQFENSPSVNFANTPATAANPQNSLEIGDRGTSTGIRGGYNSQSLGSLDTGGRVIDSPTNNTEKDMEPVKPYNFPVSNQNTNLNESSSGNMTSSYSKAPAKLNTSQEVFNANPSSNTGYILNDTSAKVPISNTVNPSKSGNVNNLIPGVLNDNTEKKNLNSGNNSQSFIMPGTMKNSDSQTNYKTVDAPPLKSNDIKPVSHAPVTMNNDKSFIVEPSASLSSGTNYKNSESFSDSLTSESSSSSSNSNLVNRSDTSSKKFEGGVSANVETRQVSNSYSRPGNAQEQFKNNQNSGEKVPVVNTGQKVNEPMLIFDKPQSITREPKIVNSAPVVKNDEQRIIYNAPNFQADEPKSVIIPSEGKTSEAAKTLDNSIKDSPIPKPLNLEINKK